MNHIARKILCVAISVIGGGAIMAGGLYIGSLASGNKEQGREETPREEPLVPKEVALYEGTFKIKMDGKDIKVNGVYNINETNTTASGWSCSLNYEVTGLDGHNHKLGLIDYNCNDTLDRYIVDGFNYEVTDNRSILYWNERLKNARETLVKPENRVNP